MRRLALWLPLVAIVGLAAVLPRVRLDVDIFNLLPADSDVVRGLKEYQQTFGSSHELIVSVRSRDAETTAAAVASLAGAFERSALTSRVIWTNPVREDPGAWSDLLAYLWLNQSPERFRAMAARFDEERLAPTLDRTLDRMSTSLNPGEVARLGADPYALSDLPPEIASILTDAGEDPFSSADRAFRVLFVQPPFEDAGFWEQRAWISGVRELLSGWRAEHAPGDSVTVRITGDPAFVAEVGSGLLEDMRQAAIGTLILVASLFWLAHRRLAPLAWLVCLLVLVLMLTVAIGGAVLGSLNAVSLGFAAILLGLAADYGLILYQEFVAQPQRSISRLRSAVAPSILWAAATTAGAFLMISRSSLPGLTQLGTLVAIGVFVAAGLMLLFFLPPLVPALRESYLAAGAEETKRVGSAGLRVAWSITLATLAISTSVLAIQRPRLDSGTDDLGPRDSAAQLAITEIQDELGGKHDALWLIVTGADESEVSRRLGEAAQVLDAAVEQGTLDGFILPDAMWPRTLFQQQNADVARRLAARAQVVRQAALGAGFADASLQLTDGVFATWGRLEETDGAVWPSHPGSRWVFRQFAAEQDGRLLALGRLDADERVTNEDLVALSRSLGSDDKAKLFGWTLLSQSLLGNMRSDIKRVLLPMGVVLIVILALAFRNPIDVALSFASLTFSLLCLLAWMALMGWSWNLMNVMALPLLFGAGVDYSIHIQLALRRHGGDLARVRRTVGRAILLCGGSTAAGFGTLAWASNAGLASLGRVCAAGIVIACVTSVVLLPVWWRTLRGRAAERYERAGNHSVGRVARFAEPGGAGRGATRNPRRLARPAGDPRDVVGGGRSDA